jgi:hypothetical protein
MTPNLPSLSNPSPARPLLKSSIASRSPGLVPTIDLGELGLGDSTRALQDSESVAPLNAVMLFSVPRNNQPAIVLDGEFLYLRICRTERNPASSTHKTCPIAASCKSLFVLELLERVGAHEPLRSQHFYGGGLWRQYHDALA